MDAPLIIAENDPKWALLGKILDTVASRKHPSGAKSFFVAKAKHGMVPSS